MMLPQSKKILEDFQVRKSRKQKEAFRVWLCGELEKAGYTPAIEKSWCASNVVVGAPERAKYLFTAHYDTCAVLPFPNFITPRNLFLYILYNLLICLGLFAAVFLVEFAVIWFWKDAPKGLVVNIPLVICCFFCWWIFFGRANRHTVNDNTSGVLTLLETALALPPEDRDAVCFVFFDNEERGMFGSNAFAGKHKAVKKQALCVNFDCVSDGDYIQLFPSKKLRRDPDVCALLEEAFLSTAEKTVEIVRGSGFYPSDNASFRRGVGVCALRHRPVLGYYMSRIHTGRDTVLEEENIMLLRDGCLRLARVAC